MDDRDGRRPGADPGSDRDRGTLRRGMAVKQRSFWDDELNADLEIKRHARRENPPTSHEAAEELIESGRMSAQCQAILERLQRRPAMSSELAQLSLKYTSRISDLRQRGHKITCTKHAGEWWYTLEEPK